MNENGIEKNIIVPFEEKPVTTINNIETNNNNYNGYNININKNSNNKNHHYIRRESLDNLIHLKGIDLNTLQSNGISSINLGFSKDGKRRYNKTNVKLLFNINYYI
jgi:hypothetical protein